MKLDKVKLLTIALPVVLIIVVLIIGAMSIFGDIKQTTETITHEAGQELALDATELFEIDEETAAKVTFDSSNVDVKKVGTYDLTAKYKTKTYKFKVEVVDTAAPSVEFAYRYVFTNDVEKAELKSMIDLIYDASDYTLELVRFEKSGTLSVMDEKALDILTKNIPLPCDEKELLALGTEDVPTEQGIYRSVLLIKDEYDNARYEEVYVILDKTGAYIDEIVDMEVTVAKDKLEEAPVLDKSKFTISDNVDGLIKAEYINCKVEVDNKEEHTWMATISYTDRAGNESSLSFPVVVKEGEASADTENNNEAADNSDKNNGNTNQNANNNQSSNTQTGNNGTTDNGGTNQGSNNNQNSNNTLTGNNGSADNSNTNNNQNSNQTQNGNTQTGNNNQSSSNNNQQYDPADTNKDGMVDGEEAYKNISASEQAAIDAGYGNVVLLPTGNYGVLTHEDMMVNGKYGGTYLREWLAERDLEPTHVSGAVINYENDWFWFIAHDVHELINEDDEEFWD